VLADFNTESHLVLSEKIVGDLVNMLRDAVDLGTGHLIRARFGLRADLAGKTGTTQKNTDGWFILMHPQLVAGAWVGFNDSRVTMRSNYWGEGGHNAVLLVGDFFQRALDARLIDDGARFPYPRQRDFILEPYMDAAKDLFDTLSDWLFGGKTKSRPMPPLLPERDRRDERD
jgi:penicillin-binding protein 1A